MDYAEICRISYVFHEPQVKEDLAFHSKNNDQKHTQIQYSLRVYFGEFVNGPNCLWVRLIWRGL